MVDAVWFGVGIGVLAIVVVVVMVWAVTRHLNHRTGNKGAIQRSRITCPKCGRTFDYEWVLGAALTAVRLGSQRYMACPLCHRWSTFDIWKTVVPASPPPPSA